jgi:hypothetical protein
VVNSAPNWHYFGKNVQAQSITPAADGTGTIVIQDGNRFNILGNTRARSSRISFHLWHFNLAAGQPQIFQFRRNSE